jgi:hypothetical protein
VVDFFGLSSSLKKKITRIQREGEDQQKENSEKIHLQVK